MSNSRKFCPKNPIIQPIRESFLPRKIPAIHVRGTCTCKKKILNQIIIVYLIINLTEAYNIKVLFTCGCLSVVQ